MAQKRRRKRGKRQSDMRPLILGIMAVVLALVVCILVGRAVLGKDNVRTPDEIAPSPTPMATAEVVKPNETGAGATPVPTEAASAPAQTASSNMLTVISRAKNAGMKVALTIDDCNDAANVMKLLDIADQHNIKLTFFPVGVAVKKNPDMVLEMYKRGHEIGNHSYSHKKMTELSEEEAISEITRQSDAVNEALGATYHMTLFRPPEGNGMKSEALHALLRSRGYEALASWGLSGTQDPDKTLSAMRSGDIILFHATDKDLTRLEYFIPKAIEKGYQFVTVNALFGREPNRVELETGG